LTSAWRPSAAITARSSAGCRPFNVDGERAYVRARAWAETSALAPRPVTIHQLEPAGPGWRQPAAWSWPCLLSGPPTSATWPAILCRPGAAAVPWPAAAARKPWASAWPAASVSERLEEDPLPCPAGRRGRVGPFAQHRVLAPTGLGLARGPQPRRTPGVGGSIRPCVLRPRWASLAGMARLAAEGRPAPPGAGPAGLSPHPQRSAKWPGHSKWSPDQHVRRRTRLQTGVRGSPGLGREIMVGRRSGADRPQLSVVAPPIEEGKGSRVTQRQYRSGDRQWLRPGGGEAGIAFEAVRYEGLWPWRRGDLVEAFTRQPHRTAPTCAWPSARTAANLGGDRCVAIFFDNQALWCGIRPERSGRRGAAGGLLEAPRRSVMSSNSGWGALSLLMPRP